METKKDKKGGARWADKGATRKKKKNRPPVTIRTQKKYRHLRGPFNHRKKGKKRKVGIYRNTKKKNGVPESNCRPALTFKAGEGRPGASLQRKEKNEFFKRQQRPRLFQRGGVVENPQGKKQSRPPTAKQAVE